MRRTVPGRRDGPSGGSVTRSIVPPIVERNNDYPSRPEDSAPRRLYLARVRLYRIPYSTNVERVALALAHKGLGAEPVDVDPRERGPVRAVSGQALVPVLELDDGEVVADSLAILRRLDELRPDPPLFPRDRARREELEVFLDWFDAVWKVPPNAIDAELGRLAPDRPRIARLGAR